MSFPYPTILCIRILCVGTLAVLPSFSALAEKERISQEQAEALVSGLKYQQGEIALQNGLATLHVPEAFRFINGPDAQTVLVAQKAARHAVFANDDYRKGGGWPSEVLGNNR